MGDPFDLTRPQVNDLPWFGLNVIPRVWQNALNAILNENTLWEGELPMHSSSDNREAIETVHELIKEIEIAMLTTVSEEGLVSRPMKTQDVEFDGDLWFLTKKDTGKFHELLRNSQVNIAYAGKSFVSIRGKAELVESTEKLKQFWSAAYEKFLETHVDDPNLVLIKVEAETAEFWDTGNKFKMVKFLLRRLLGKNTEGTEINRIVELK